MSENTTIELFNELPKFFFGNEKYLLLRAAAIGLDEFDSCTLLINDKILATAKAHPNYNSEKQKVCENAFQFLVALPNLKSGIIVEVGLKFLLNNKTKYVKLASIPVKKVNKNYETDETEMVAVCMPLFQPNLKLFRQQLQSIQKQSYQKIKIFIQDDCSTLSIFNEVKELVEALGNVYLFRNDENLGFYKNVELLLNKVGDSFKYIALSDQDDVWELDKLEKQINFLKEKQADLCYTDLKIVTENGEILQESFWLDKSNHLQKPFALNLRNVATGCTILLKQNVLNTILPFPQAIGKAHHDHYLTAQLQNTRQHKVVYLNEPLVNYVQHNNNVTGFSKTSNVSLLSKIINDFALLKLVGILLFKNNITAYEPAIEAAKKYYHLNCQRLKLMLVHQHKLSVNKFFSNNTDIKLALHSFYLSYQSYFSKIKLNRFDEAIYKSIFTQLALKLRYWWCKK